MEKSQHINVSLTTMVQVARLYYEENLSQQEIASRLGVSRSLIAHYLKNAREQGLVKIEILDPRDTCADLARSIQQHTTIKSVTVVPASHNSAMLTRRAVAGVTARYLESVLADWDIVGLSWGRSIMEVVNVLETTAPRQIEVVPILGESSYYGTYSQVNQMTLQFANNFDGKPYFLLAPMHLPSRSMRDELIKDDALRYVTERWERLTYAVMGIGAIPSAEGQVLYLGEEMAISLLETGAVGDLAARYFTSEGKFVLFPLNERLVGISLDQLRKVKNVIAVANGIEKAKATAGALRTGLISDLFIDDELGKALLEEIFAQGEGVVVRSGGR